MTEGSDGRGDQQVLESYRNEPAVVVTDPEGFISAWSPQAAVLFGWSEDEVLGRPITEMLLTEDQLAVAAKILAWARQAFPEARTGSYRLRRKDNQLIDVESVSFRIIRDEELDAVVGISLRVTALRPLEADLAALLDTTNVVRAAAIATEQWAASFLETSRNVTSAAALDDLIDSALAALANSLGAEAASLLVADEDGTLLTARAAYGWAAEVEQHLQIAAGAGVSGRVLAEGAPLIVAELDDEDVVSPALRDSGFHSYVGVPLVAGPRVNGVLHATSFSPDHFSARDVELLNLFAGPLASAIERVRLLEAEHAARLEAERNSELLSALQRLSAALVRAARSAEVREAVLSESRLISLAEAQWEFWEWQSGTMVLTQSVASMAEAPVRAIDASFGWQGVGTEPAFVEMSTEVRASWPEAAEAEMGAFACLPLLAAGEHLGYLALRFQSEHEFSPAERKFLLAVADQAASAFRRVELVERERRVAAEERQRSQLVTRAVAPSALPLSDRVELFACYQPAEGGGIGGDWYDAFFTPSGSLALVTGDVAGHGVEASSAMAWLRHAILLFAHEETSPAAMLRRIQRIVAAATSPSFGPDFATLVLGIYEPTTRTLVTASAGHLPWLLVRNGGADFVEGQNGPISRNLPVADFREQQCSLMPGDLITFYTDGLVEVRGEHLDDGLARLAIATLEHAGEPLEAVASAILEATNVTTRGDDLSLLLMRVK